MDPNREDLEGAQGDPLAIQAYREFHSAINHAKGVVKRGLLVDFHGFNLDWVFGFILWRHGDFHSFLLRNIKMDIVYSIQIINTNNL